MLYNYMAEICPTLQLVVVLHISSPHQISHSVHDNPDPYLHVRCLSVAMPHVDSIILECSCPLRHNHKII